MAIRQPQRVEVERRACISLRKRGFGGLTAALVIWPHRRACLGIKRGPEDDDIVCLRSKYVLLEQMACRGWLEGIDSAGGADAPGKRHGIQPHAARRFHHHITHTHESKQKIDVEVCPFPILDERASDG